MRHGLTAAAGLRVDRAAQRTRMRWTHAWPVILRPTGDERVHLVHGAGGPLGGDVLSLAVDVAGGARLDVRSAGATIVQPGIDGGTARWDVACTVDGHLHWAPEPTIVTDGAALDATLRADLAAGATAVLVETVVLGRHGQRGGRYRGEQVVTVDGRTLLAHVTHLEGDDPALSGPGGTAGARAVASALVVGLPAGSGAGEDAGVHWAWTPLAGPGAMLLAVGEPAAVAAVLGAQIPAELPAQSPVPVQP